MPQNYCLPQRVPVGVHGDLEIALQFQGPSGSQAMNSGVSGAGLIIKQRNNTRQTQIISFE